jgi:hypothetical protein
MRSSKSPIGANGYQLVSEAQSLFNMLASSRIRSSHTRDAASSKLPKSICFESKKYFSPPVPGAMPSDFTDRIGNYCRMAYLAIAENATSRLLIMTAL